MIILRQRQVIQWKIEKIPIIKSETEMESPFVYKLCIKIWKTEADQVIFQHSDIKVHLFWFSSLS